MQNETANMFEPKIFQEMVNAFEPNRDLKLLNSVPKDTTLYPYVQWVVKGGRASTLAEYNVPNAKANVIEREGGQANASASLAYIREGDYFTPSTTLLVKDLEAGDDRAIAPAEKAVAEQVKAVNDRIDNRIEWSLWQAMLGGFTYTGANTGTFAVDYNFRPTHKATVDTAEMWDATPSVQQLIAQIRNAKQLVQKDGGVAVKNVYLTRATMDLLIEAWTDSATTDANRALLTDTMINEYMQTGSIKGFMGSGEWEVVESYYDVRNEDGSIDIFPYLPHGTVLFANHEDNRPLKYTNGPSVDFSAPQGHIGRFAKNWLSQDPSGRQFLIEESGLPVLDRPDQFVALKVASDTWADAQTF